MTLPLYRSLHTQLLLYTEQRNLKAGALLHSLVIKTGWSSSTFLSNALINFYAKCEKFSQAHLKFEEIENKDVVSYNCIINGFSQMCPKGSSSTRVMDPFRKLQAETEIFPNPHTFAGAFAAASNSCDAVCGVQVHAVALKLHCVSDVFVASSLINMYGKCGLVLEAQKVFDKMPVRNSVSWASMVSGYAMQRMAKEAIGVFRLMCREEENLNEFVVTSVLSALVGFELVDIGKQIHCVSVKSGLISLVSVGNALVTMYGKCGSLDDALYVFQVSTDKNPITWSAMITGYAQNSDSNKALELFSHMHFSGIRPSEFTLVGVLNACSDICAIQEGKQVHAFVFKLGFELQIYVMSAVVDMYAKCGSIADARTGFNYLPEADLVLWTSMISGCVQNGENEEALALYGKMEMEGILPNELTLASVLRACSSLAALEQGKQIHARAIKYGYGLEIPIGSALSTMYAKCGSLDDGNFVFRMMPSRDVVSWNAMISGLSQNGLGDEALKLFEDMCLEGTKPDYVTFVNVLNACSHMGLVGQGWCYFNMMLDDFGLAPRVEHYACMVDILSRAGKLNEAKEFIESATIDHGMCLWRILLSACKNYRNYELGAYAGEKLMELGSQESSAYVLLSSIYTALGRREDVERVKKMMNLRGVSKEPGCSWIELKSQIHVFVVGDQMHPQINDIRLKLQGLRKQMKDEDYSLVCC